MFTLKPFHAMLGMAIAALSLGAQAAVPATTPTLPVGSPEELTSPYVLAPGYAQRVIADRNTQLAQGQGNSGNWDMIDTNRTGPDANRYLFMPFETGTGGVQRVDLWNPNYATRTVTIVAPGTKNFVAGDASRWTPWGTYLTAEETWSDPAAATSSHGRLFEVTNPTTAGTNGGNFVHRSFGPADVRVSHEGLAFDKANNLYFIDERNNSFIFKYTSANPNATNGTDYFSAGQTSVLRVGDGSAKEATGAYTWVPLTDAAGNALPGAVVKTDPNGLTVLDGRATPQLAAFLGTRFDRPEDIELKTLADGTEQLYMSTTTNHKVFALDLGAAQAKLFVDPNTLDGDTGLPVGSIFRNPDNLAIAPDGTMFVVEDQPGGVENLWKTVDANNDGVAESMSIFATLRTAGAESTGMFFLGEKIYVNVQHPDSLNDVLVEITPVPEPGTYALMLAGLGVVGTLASRRKALRSVNPQA